MSKEKQHPRRKQFLVNFKIRHCNNIYNLRFICHCLTTPKKYSFLDFICKSFVGLGDLILVRLHNPNRNIGQVTFPITNEVQFVQSNTMATMNRGFSKANYFCVYSQRNSLFNNRMPISKSL